MKPVLPCPLDYIILYGYEQICKNGYNAPPGCVFECNVKHDVLVVKPAECRRGTFFVCDGHACYCCIGLDEGASKRHIAYGVKGGCRDESDVNIDLRVVNSNVLIEHGVSGDCVGMPFDELHFNNDSVLMIRRDEEPRRLELQSVNVGNDGVVIVKWRYEGTHTWVGVEDSLVFRVCIRVYRKSV